ncbi:putative phosphoglycerate mutase [Kitasatospora sp. MAA4]|uniref:histidine phosphatase family protein n=1 Tax=Kitasatospora sp. MAA4 TaxID=3035093 RepID=UPI002475687F|nr:histidine phosphatase family protein [Kitasatospora sp. MAA4]MDH6132801.1 putative phosphoglycerate mutase [Kitasatospora sp. MAA4]
MTTYLLRHASTTYSTRYQVNGDPAVVLPLDAAGRTACSAARDALCTLRPAVWVCSGFARTSETARLLMAEPGEQIDVEYRLDELHYGEFEGGPFLTYARWLAAHGPWARPPGARESQREGIRRMLAGLRRMVELPSPRVVIAHGLLVSVLRWWLELPAGAPTEPMPIFFDEVRCLDLVQLGDEELLSLVGALLNELAAEERSGVPSGGWETGREVGLLLANVEAVSIQLEETNPHA